MTQLLKLLKCLVFSTLIIIRGAWAQDLTEALYYDIGSPTLKELYVNYLTGNDSNSGLSAGTAFKTVTAAWNSIPQAETLTTTGYRINIAPGEYPASATPNY